MRLDDKAVREATNKALNEGCVVGSPKLTERVAELLGAPRCEMAYQMVYDRIPKATGGMLGDPRVALMYTVHGTGHNLCVKMSIIKRVFTRFEDIIMKEGRPDYRVLLNIILCGRFEFDEIVIDEGTGRDLNAILDPVMKRGTEDRLLRDLTEMKEASRRVKQDLRAICVDKETRQMINQIAMGVATRVIQA